ncbi:hypothetical protein SynMVIR181_01556 [Synechococcus sp. MVIR-18-1]|nr:hypothetical protein SynMVIR181_01556 [Synechococcus sp. MVIR-18-1]
MSGYSTKFFALNAPLVIDTTVVLLALSQLTALRVAKKDQI